MTTTETRNVSAEQAADTEYLLLDQRGLWARYAGLYNGGTPGWELVDWRYDFNGDDIEAWIAAYAECGVETHYRGY